MERSAARFARIITGWLLLLLLVLVAAAAGRVEAATYIDDFSESLTRPERTAPLPRLPEIACQNGPIQIEGTVGLVVHVPPEFCWVDKLQATKLIVDWGNPPSSTASLIGMLLPGPAATRAARHAIVLRFNAVGHVADQDAADPDHDAVLHFLKLSNIAVMAEQARNRSTIFRINDWFAKPHYDNAAKIWHLPLILGHGSTDEFSLNYWLLILGRAGFVSMHLMGGPERRDELIMAAPKLAAMIQFSAPHRHRDFDAGRETSAVAALKQLFVPAYSYTPGRGRVATEISLTELLVMFLVVLGTVGVAVRYWFRRLTGLPPAPHKSKIQSRPNGR
jgi:uncharacterized membrane-anchored protein